MYRVAPFLVLKKLETAFQHKVFRMILATVTQKMIAMPTKWQRYGES
jgi:hypothetical protein